MKDVFFDLPANHYPFEYQFKFTGNKVSYLVGDSRKEIDVDVFLSQYNQNAKSSGLAQKSVMTDLFQLNNPDEIACFKKTVSVLVEKAEIVQAKWSLPSKEKKVSTALLYNKSEQKFYIQKDTANIELKPNHFLNDFKKQYRKERPWYGNVAELLGFGTLGKLKKQSTDAAKIEFLINHAKESADSTTAKTLETLFQTTDFVDAFKKQYRKERPWYGLLTEKMRAGTLGKLSEKEKNAVDFLRDHGKEKSDSTTAKTLESLKEFSVYGGGVKENAPIATVTQAADKLPVENESAPAAITTPMETPSASADRQTPISSDRLSVEAMLRMRDFPLQRADLEKQEQAAREALASASFGELEKVFQPIAEQEKVERVQAQKLTTRHNLLKALESSLKLFWFSVDRDPRNLQSNQKKYIEANDYGVTKIQCLLNFSDNQIAALAAFSADDENIKKHQWIQSTRVLYERFERVRDCLWSLVVSDEEVSNRINGLMQTVNRLVEAGVLDKSVFKNISRACALYQLDAERVNAVSAVPAMRL